MSSPKSPVSTPGASARPHPNPLSPTDTRLRSLAWFGLCGILPFIAYAVSLGAGLWWLAYHGNTEVMLDNGLPTAARLQQVTWVAVALLSVVAAWAGTLYMQRRRGSTATVNSTTATFNQWMLWALLVPVLAGLSAPKIELENPFFTVLLACLGAAIAGTLAYRAGAPTEPGSPDHNRFRNSAFVALGLLALWGGYTWFFSEWSILNHHAMNSRVMDLGVYDNIFYQSSHGNPLGCGYCRGGNHASGHFDPILVFLSPSYRLYPQPEFLLALQSFWLGSGVIPVYLLAHTKLKLRWMAFALSVAWILYPAMHGANMYEFHSLTLISPLIVWLLYMFERGHRIGYFAVFALLLATREDVSLLLCFVGLYGLLSNRRGDARVGLATILISLAYFVSVKGLAMGSPAFLGSSGADSYSHAYYYKDMMPNREGSGGFLLTLVTNPVFLVAHVVSELKCLYLLLLFAPLAFLPLFAGRSRVMFTFGLVFILLASKKPVYSLGFQYACLIFPIAFALAPEGILRWGERLQQRHGLHPGKSRRALVISLLAASVLISWKYGGFVPNASFHGGFGTPVRTLNPRHEERIGWVREVTGQIPQDASVGATSTTGSHVSNRMNVGNYRGKGTKFEWLFVNTRDLKGKQKTTFENSVKRGEYTEVAKSRNLVLLKRVPGGNRKAKPRRAPPPGGKDVASPPAP